MPYYDLLKCTHYANKRPAISITCLNDARYANKRPIMTCLKCTRYANKGFFMTCLKDAFYANKRPIMTCLKCTYYANKRLFMTCLKDARYTNKRFIMTCFAKYIIKAIISVAPYLTHRDGRVRSNYKSRDQCALYKIHTV